MKKILFSIFLFYTPFLFANEDLPEFGSMFDKQQVDTFYQCRIFFEGIDIEGECYNGAYLPARTDLHIFGNCENGKYEIVYRGTIVSGTCNDENVK